MDRDKMRQQMDVLKNKRLQSSQSRQVSPPPRPLVKNKVVVTTPTPAKSSVSQPGTAKVRRVNVNCGTCSRKLGGK